MAAPGDAQSTKALAFMSYFVYLQAYNVYLQAYNGLQRPAKQLSIG